MGRPSLVLDSAGFVALGTGDPKAAAMFKRAIDSDWDVIVPVEVVAEVMRLPMAPGVRDWQKRVLRMVHIVVSPTVEDALLAGGLLARSSADNIVDAFVVVAALRALPAFILTSDDSDIRTLLDTQADGKRVSVVHVSN